ncbi:putative P-loop containing nucleoside triphosphate hydrolase, leucine-rich repeat domain, L [Rosa chinensis]|uniref:Putative P-loop containing nucleoside triphosphate hydrolase, leucine-rich repeat domain, L n=1 Tax=Rosa chinensis TaxID=74649 RepID=A0A2P6SEF2_ROSCH|nr:probable disease resistance protein At1g58602 isoform X1 [Rosa chinensis]XP_040373598.1 probable disease resistance protein At1g58602 isoform X1 [Rosa chinensis]XP_040373600.1 probable disease resistance protein At1g58602 isoform X1 [Rosa chinensis]XP_040373603.1 probable disease resistance protein At1g58602 isoform X1 [Rosa chinensis]XP_040373607.1 probable disease resistance protein At1g58602 isoform X1 [Rosa chinensis]PRQ57056.1 putative P-loop containing nucleoside triphosphate hydrolas
MAEGVVTVVAEGIKPLGEFIIQQAKFLGGVSNQIELAQNELHVIRGFLKDADTRQQDEERVRNCVELIRDAAYDLEDVIESFYLKVASRRRGGTEKRIVLKRFACIFNEGLNRYKIGSEIEHIMAKLSRLRSNLETYNIRQISGGESVASGFKRQPDRRRTYAHEVESHIVGLEEITGTLVKKLVKEGKRHLVISIWGMGGSGKTTLAKQVFRQNEIKRHFDCFAWVSISQQWEGKVVLEEILIKLTSPSIEKRKEISKMKMDEIAEEVYSIQREERCLVVLDDIWTQEAWNSIKAGFPINEETESRILLTTRKKEVALLASRNDHLHQPQQLDDNQCWELFEKIAICGSDKTDFEIDAEKRKLGEEMLKHCSGLPLAITVLAGLLSRRETVDEWKTVLGNVNVYIMRGTNVPEREKTSQECGVSGVLALSYDDLPSHLKLCFLYLAQYPEDHEIQVTRLTQLWIAEGFIPSTSEIHGSIELMEDVSYGCLTELVQRSMVQVGIYGSSGKVKRFRLHDLMRDLCLQKAKEENFLGIVNSSLGLGSNAALIGKVRRLALYLDENEDGRDGHIRSLLYFGLGEINQKWNKRIIRSVFNDFKLLRVLQFENIFRDFDLPKTIGNLVHLRFLSLKNSEFRALPSSVSNLVLLQTLDLRGIGTIRTKIRNVFWNLEQLRHLYLPVYSDIGKLSFARLCNLQTLVNVRIEECDWNDLVQLSNLKKLRIRASETSELEKLKDMLISRNRTYKHLRSLSLQVNRPFAGDIIPSDIVLRCPHLYKLQLEGKITAFPKELPNLAKLTLFGTRLKGDQIEILETLPNLRVLYLGWLSFESETMVFSQGGFPHLEFLNLGTLEDLKEWRVEKEAMPSLQRLRIERCRELRAVPDGLQEITTLKELTIDGMPSRFCSRGRRRGFLQNQTCAFSYNHKYRNLALAEGASRCFSSSCGSSW